MLERLWLKSLKVTDLLADPGVDGRIMLKGSQGDWSLGCRFN
jgi:hypothetical protein